MEVISASRRTDIPAFYMDWLIERIEDGYVNVPNPRNMNQVSRILLTPEEVHTIILWSKNFHDFLLNRRAFSAFHLYFQFTINGSYPNMEPGLFGRVRTDDSLTNRIRQFEELVMHYGPQSVMWRFDPIVHWVNSCGEIVSNVASFFSMIPRMYHAGARNCTFSFVTWYPKAKRRARNRNFQYYEPSLPEKRVIVKDMRASSYDFGIKLHTCNGREFLDIPNINQAHCVDGNLLSNLKGQPASKRKASGQRPTCACTHSRDIGNYHFHQCKHNCVYCYANPVEE